MDRKHLKTSDLNKIFNNSSFILVARTIEIVFNLISVALIARYLGPKSFGEFAFIMALATTVIFISGFGTEQVLIRDSAKDRTKAATLLGTALINRLLSSLVGSSLLLIALFFFQAGISPSWMMAIYISLFFEILNAFSNVYLADFKAIERMEYDTIITAAGSLISLAMIFLIVWYDLKFLALFTAMGLGKSVRFIYCIYLSNTKFLPPVFHMNLEKQYNFFKKSLGIGLGLVFRFLSLKVDVFFLQAMKGSVAVGLFGPAHRFTMAFQIFPQSIVQAVFPMLSRLGRDNSEKIAYVYKVYITLFYIISLPISIMVFVLAKDLIVLVFGDKFIDAAPALQVLSLGVPLMFIIPLAAFVLLAINKQNLIAISTGLSLLLNIILDLALIPHYGVVGAAIATFFAYIFLSLITIYFVYREIGGLPSISRIVMASIIGLSLYIMLSFMKDLHYMFVIFAGLSVYVILIFAFRCIRFSEIKGLWQYRHPKRLESDSFVAPD